MSDTTITPEQIEAFAALGACKPALNWLREAPRRAEDARPEWCVWALELASARLTDEQFDVAVKAEPGAALAYASARYNAWMEARAEKTTRG